MTEPVDSSILLVAAAALYRDDGCVLLQRRADSSEAGLWEFPGGKLEPGESPEAALARELAEELGIAVDPRHLEPAGFASTGVRGRPLLLLLYRVIRWTGEPRALVADALCWARPSAMSALPMPAADYPLAAHLALLETAMLCR